MSMELLALLVIGLICSIFAVFLGSILLGILVAAKLIFDECMMKMRND